MSYLSIQVHSLSEWNGLAIIREEVYLEYIKMIEKILLMMYNMTINKAGNDRMVIHTMKKFQVLKLHDCI